VRGAVRSSTPSLDWGHPDWMRLLWVNWMPSVGSVISPNDFKWVWIVCLHLEESCCCVWLHLINLLPLGLPWGGHAEVSPSLIVFVTNLLGDKQVTSMRELINLYSCYFPTLISSLYSILLPHVIEKFDCFCFPILIIILFGLILPFSGTLAQSWRNQSSRPWRRARSGDLGRREGWKVRRKARSKGCEAQRLCIVMHNY